ncbi:MAG: glycosyltransferase family 4 protein [Chloroflexi bacterium]|nr:glycosyltransferase family 4 protein [Chloroflexota bacterium]
MTQGKHIAVFSMTPLFPEMVMGGGQAQLKKVALHLGEQGHKLTILSTRREGSQAPFRWHDNVEILPILRFKQPYPEPYFTPIYHIANAMRYVGAAIAAADVHYSHDGGLIFPYVYQRKPTVISLRSIIYPETMQCAFLFQGDAWILPSEHTRASYHAAVAQFAPAVGERMHAIHNGFDWDFFRYTPPQSIFEMIPRSIAERPTLLFPHRPEAAKGIYEVVQVARKLVHDHDWHDLRVLVPRWLDADTAPANRDYYAKLRQAIHEATLDDNFVFHDWVPEAQIAEYYSLADATLCIGNCVETFGNTVFESLGCGTPVIAARVATYRDLLPEEHISRVDYGDIDAAADLADQLLRTRRRASAATQAYLRAHFSQERMVSRYADVIVNARQLPPLAYRVPRLDESTRYRLAPWCSVSARRGIFHDFHSDYTRDEILLRLSREHPDGFAGAAVAAQRLRSWLDEGFVVPVPDLDSAEPPK